MKKLLTILLTLCLTACICQTALARFNNIMNHRAVVDLQEDEVYVDATLALNRSMPATIKLQVIDTDTGGTRTYTARDTDDVISMVKWVPVQSNKLYEFKFTFTAGTDNPTEIHWVET